MVENTKKLFNKIRSHIFRGKRFKFSWRKPRSNKGFNKEINPMDIMGYTHFAEKKIQIDPNLSEDDFLKVVIDEGLHACMWDLDNEAVDEIATDLASLLKRIGFKL